MTLPTVAAPPVTTVWLNSPAGRPFRRWELFPECPHRSSVRLKGQWPQLQELMESRRSSRRSFASSESTFINATGKTGLHPPFSKSPIPAAAPGPETLNNAITLLNLSTDPTNTITFVNLSSPCDNYTYGRSSGDCCAGHPPGPQHRGEPDDQRRRLKHLRHAIRQRRPTPSPSTSSRSTNGLGSGQSTGATGGAIPIGDEAVTLSNCVLTANTAPERRGRHT